MEELRPLSYAFNEENVKKFIDAIQDGEAKKTILSSRTFKSLPLMKTLNDSLKRLSV
jgi:hypothetical protein